MNGRLSTCPVDSPHLILDQKLLSKQQPLFYYLRNDAFFKRICLSFITRYRRKRDVRSFKIKDTVLVICGHNTITGGTLVSATNKFNGCRIEWHDGRDCNIPFSRGSQGAHNEVYLEVG